MCIEGCSAACSSQVFYFKPSQSIPSAPSPEQHRRLRGMTAETSMLGLPSSPGEDRVSQEAGGCGRRSCGLPKATLSGAFPLHAQFLQAFGARTPAPHPRWLPAQNHTTPCPSSFQQHLLGIFNRFAHQ